MKKSGRHILVILLLIFLFIVLGFLVYQFAIPRLGYCFDTEFDDAGERLYVTAGQRGLHVFRVSPQGAVEHITTYFDDGYHRYVEVVGDKVYLANNERGLEILDIQNDPGLDSYGESVIVQGDNLYLSMIDTMSSEENGLHIFDLHDPSSPRLLARYSIPDHIEDIAVAGTQLAIANSYLGVAIFDVHDPENSILKGTYSSRFWRSLTMYFW